MSEFVDYLHEVFEAFGPIRTRRMFGGYGVYRDGIMFALVADDVLYLKADGESEMEFSRRNLEQFEYVKNGQPMKMSYFIAPEEIYEDSVEAKAWATLALEAALRSKSKVKNKQPKSGGGKS